MSQCLSQITSTLNTGLPILLVWSVDWMGLNLTGLHEDKIFVDWNIDVVDDIVVRRTDQSAVAGQLDVQRVIYGQNIDDDAQTGMHSVSSVGGNGSPRED